jgi:hypothetical protein
LSIRYAIDAYVAKAVEAVDDDDLSCAGEDAAKVARILSDVAVNLATLDAPRSDDPVFVGPGDVVIDHEGFVWRFDGDVEWDIVDYVGDDPEIQARFDDDAPLSCDDPCCPCHDDVCDDCTCDDCGADLGFTDDDVIVTLRVGDNGYGVNVEGPICQDHGDALVADVFDLAHKHFGDDEGSLVDRAASDVVIRIDGPIL